MRCSPTYPQILLPLLYLPAALYNGDSRTRTLDITVTGDDGVAIVAWTSSGETDAFETIELGVQGKFIRLRGVLTDSEWLSILEVGAAEDNVASSVGYTAHDACLRKPHIMNYFSIRPPSGIGLNSTLYRPGAIKVIVEHLIDSNLLTYFTFLYFVACTAIDAQVGILVDDGNDDGAADVVEAGELGPVASSAEYYDPRLADTVGCDPAGCSAALTRVCVLLALSCFVNTPLVTSGIVGTVESCVHRFAYFQRCAPGDGLISCMLVSFPCHRPLSEVCCPNSRLPNGAAREFIILAPNAAILEATLFHADPAHRLTRMATCPTGPGGPVRPSWAALAAFRTTSAPLVIYRSCASVSPQCYVRIMKHFFRPHIGFAYLPESSVSL